MKRFGMMIGLRPEHYEEYKRYHSAVWPEVQATIERCNIRNYTIYHHDGILFASYEYYGTDHAADMARIIVRSGHLHNIGYGQSIAVLKHVLDV